MVGPSVWHSCPLGRDTREIASFLFLPCEDLVRRQLSVNQEKDPHQGIKLISAVILEFLASRIVRSKFLLFKSLSLCDILLWQFN